MYCILIISRYPKWLGLFGFLSMAFFRLPLIIHKKIKFWKLMGSGKNGTFDKHPDWGQWAMLVVIEGMKSETLTVKDGMLKDVDNEVFPIPSLIRSWLSFFHCRNKIYILEPIEGHGLWDGKEVFGQLPKQSGYEGKIAVLTRATIRISRLKKFWENVDSVAAQMNTAPGFVESYGIGEVPWIKQATFSIWENKEAMKTFAYTLKEHKNVIQKTRKENWYSEEMFVRFKVINFAIS